MRALALFALVAAAIASPANYAAPVARRAAAGDSQLTELCHESMKESGNNILFLCNVRGKATGYTLDLNQYLAYSGGKLVGQAGGNFGKSCDDISVNMFIKIYTLCEGTAQRLDLKDVFTFKDYKLTFIPTGEILESSSEHTESTPAKNTVDELCKPFTIQDGTRTITMECDVGGEMVSYNIDLNKYIANRDGKMQGVTDGNSGNFGDSCKECKAVSHELSCECDGGNPQILKLSTLFEPKGKDLIYIPTGDVVPKP